MKDSNEIADDIEMRKHTGEAVPRPTSVIAEHEVGPGDTLSHISLEYYGSATKPYWMVIYEANKEIIGDDPNKVTRGITLKIPTLPDDLEMKK